MQPYMNPNYFNQYQMPMYQQQQNVSLPNNGIRTYNNLNEIAVNEIPMDGTYKLFAKADMTEVVAKCWTPNGNIQTLEYSLKQPLTNENADNVTQIDLTTQFEPILAEIKALNEKIDRLNKPTSTNQRNVKKEVVDNV